MFVHILQVGSAGPSGAHPLLAGGADECKPVLGSKQAGARQEKALGRSWSMDEVEKLVI